MICSAGYLQKHGSIEILWPKYFFYNISSVAQEDCISQHQLLHYGVDALTPRPFSADTLWRPDLLVPRLFGAKTFRCQDSLAPRPFGVETPIGFNAVTFCPEEEYFVCSVFQARAISIETVLQKLFCTRLNCCHTPSKGHELRSHFDPLNSRINTTLSVV